MSAYIRGKFLEFCLRKVLLRCGFANVGPEDPYIFERPPLLFINGKGAAHDADVLMDPPIQIPFAYPSRILFECKAFTSKVNLTIVRNASGLRNDLNDFEIVDIESLRRRQNNRWADLAIANRKRYFYQVGVAALRSFTSPAIEFSANNKIALFSLEQAFLGSQLLALIEAFPANAEYELGEENYGFLKELLSLKNDPGGREEALLQLLSGFQEIGQIVSELKMHLDRIHVGVLESGEIVFITRNLMGVNFYPEEDPLSSLSGRNLLARIHWNSNNPSLWNLELNNYSPLGGYSFYLPNAIANSWARFEDRKAEALNIKATQFSRIFVFSRKQPENLPFNVITLDQPWIEDLRRQTRQGHDE